MVEMGQRHQGLAVQMELVFVGLARVPHTGHNIICSDAVQTLSFEQVANGWLQYHKWQCESFVHRFRHHICADE